jgi:CRP/FNR family transcriptional regulator, cyclic AMP receptor protein
MEQSPTDRTGLRNRLKLAFRSPVNERLREVSAILRTSPFFAELRTRTLRRLADYMHVRDYRAQETIFFDGDPGIGLYVIADGRVSMLLEEADGAVHEIRVAGPGEMFGELSVLGGTRRNETAQAMTDVRVLGLFRPDLLSLVKRHPRSGAEVMSVFAHHLAQREHALIQKVSQRDGRLAALRLFESDGLAGPIAREDAPTSINP